jgi:hypothetical protein
MKHPPAGELDGEEERRDQRDDREATHVETLRVAVEVHRGKGEQCNRRAAKEPAHRPGNAGHEPIRSDQREHHADKERVGARVGPDVDGEPAVAGPPEVGAPERSRACEDDGEHGDAAQRETEPQRAEQEHRPDEIELLFDCERPQVRQVRREAHAANLRPVRRIRQHDGKGPQRPADSVGLDQLDDEVHHQEQHHGRKQAQRPPCVERSERPRFGSLATFEDQARDEEAAQHEEDVDTEEAPREERSAPVRDEEVGGVVEHDEGDRDGTQPVEARPVPQARRVGGCAAHRRVSVPCSAESCARAASTAA